QRHAVVNLGIGLGQFVTQSRIDGEMRRDFIRVLYIYVPIVAANAAREVADALQEDDRLPHEKAGERVGHRERREHKEAVGRDALQHVNLLALVSTAELQLVLAAHPTQRSRNVVNIFIGVARYGDRIPHFGIAAYLYERRSGGNIETGV